MCDNVITHSSAAEITTLWRYTNVFIIIIIFFLTPVLNSQGMKKLRYAIQKSIKIKLEWTLFLLLLHKTVMQ